MAFGKKEKRSQSLELLSLERKDALPIVLHADDGPAFGVGFIKRLIEFADT